MSWEQKFKQTEIGMIPEDWEVKEIQNVGEVIGGGTPSTKNKRYWNGKIAWITPKDLSNHKSRYVKNGERNITEEGLLQSSAKILPKGAVLLTTRAPVGYLAIAKNEVTTNQGFHSIIPKENTTALFLYYLLKRNVEYLKSNSSGTTFGELSGSRLKTLKFSFPPLIEQQTIAKILSGFDSKIELNQRVNRTLEAIGAAVFRRWFVDFEFPNEEGKPYKSSGGKMVYSELGKIPKGWEITDISKVTNVIDCLHSKKPERVKEGKILLQVFNIEENGELTLSDLYYVSDVDYDFWIQKIEVKKGDLIISKTGRVGAIAQIPEGLKFGIGRNLVAIRPTKITPTFTLEYLLSKYGKREIQRMTMSGTILRSLHVKYIKKFQILVPPSHVINLYEKIARPFRAQIENNLKENIILTSLGKTMLPKLMSGKIRVPILEDKVEAS